MKYKVHGSTVSNSFTLKVPHGVESTWLLAPAYASFLLPGTSSGQGVELEEASRERQTETPLWLNTRPIRKPSVAALNTTRQLGIETILWIPALEGVYYSYFLFPASPRKGKLAKEIITVRNLQKRKWATIWFYLQCSLEIASRVSVEDYIPDSRLIPNYQRTSR